MESESGWTDEEEPEKISGRMGPTRQLYGVI
jgi:hypothetical protein